jgi:arsenite methyltransferase
MEPPATQADDLSVGQTVSAMKQPQHDMWYEWLLKRRYGGNVRQTKAMMRYLCPVRNKVLRHARLKEGETLLDVGCGDGLIGFGALEKTASARVVFSDISEDLLSHARSIAENTGVLDRCEFTRAAAEDLSVIAGGSVDVVTTRSVLIYVSLKQQALCEFYRVLKPGGRLSIFEPINRPGYPERPDSFGGYDVSAVAAIAQKVKAVYEQIQPPESDPMIDFDERDLFRFAHQAGFGKVHLELQVKLGPQDTAMDWNTMLRVAANPKVPTLEEAMEQALSPAEREVFVAHLRPLVEAGGGTIRSAVAYLWAVKSE